MLGEVRRRREKWEGEKAGGGKVTGRREGRREGEREDGKAVRRETQKSRSRERLEGSKLRAGNRERRESWKAGNRYIEKAGNRGKSGKAEDGRSGGRSYLICFGDITNDSTHFRFWTFVGGPLDLHLSSNQHFSLLYLKKII
jgi:hypothetical protein